MRRIFDRLAKAGADARPGRPADAPSIPAAAGRGGLDGRGGTLPDDFDPDAYRLLHPDLRDLEGPGALEEHYLRFGRSEGRDYRMPEIDPAFYRARYEDLAAVESDADLVRHFIEHGRHEGRLPSPEALLASLEAGFGALPEDFDPLGYGALHGDLDEIEGDWRLAEHYLRYGRTEGRPYAIGEFDPAFYRRQHGDLADLPDDTALARHYARGGSAEGRLGSPGALVAALEEEFGPLPVDFSPAEYRLLHGDLHGKVESWELQEHYLRYGRAEGRRYSGFDLTGYERDYERLRAEDAAAGLPPGPAGFVQLLAAAGLRPGRWLDRFMLYEFAILNAEWLPRTPRSRLDGLRLFVEGGLERLAPITLDGRFDPDFVRSIAPVAAGAESDADLYRAWLNDGVSLGSPANEGQALTGLLGEDGFPDSFDEARYRSGFAARKGPRPGRFNALEHFVRIGFAQTGDAVVNGPGAARLLEQIGNYHLVRGEAAVALKAFDAAYWHAPERAQLHHRRGDALRALGQFREATASYRVAAQEEDASLWSHIHAAEGLVAEPDGASAALAQLERSARSQRGSPQWRDAAHRVVTSAFYLWNDEARLLYADGRRAEADALLSATLDRLAAVIDTVDPLPARLPRPGNGRVVIVANRDLPQCDHYRVVQKLEQLEHGGWEVELFSQGEAGSCRSAIDRADVVIFYRVAALPAVLHAILYARALGVPTIYEIDDLLFEPEVYPDPFESFEGQITPRQYVDLQNGVPLFRYAMRLCDAGIASTPALAEAMRPHLRTGVCHVLRNGLDSRNLPFLARTPRAASPGTLTVFYGSGTKAHNSDFTELAAPALVEVLERYPQVRLVIAGYLRLDERFAPFTDRVVQLGFTTVVADYWQVLSGVDINLAVLLRTPMTDAKSEIKWLEAALCGVPSIVSATRTYAEILADGETALFAETAADWTRALRTLIEDPALRRAIGERAREKALAEYGLDEAVAVLRRALPPPVPPERREPERVPAGAARPRPGFPPPARAARRTPRSRPAGSAPRVLVVNVYFPPQLIGGATRVVRDNVDHFIDRAADRIEIAVAAADAEAETPYRTRTDRYRGVPVFRVAAPREADMDWRAFNPAMRVPFEELFDRFGPDLVHLHCIQHLTASIVEALIERGIPFVVTLHDAWWISDFQFLVDEDGQVHAPTPDPFADATSRARSATSSIARRQRLGALLRAADGLLAVSESFAQLYRDAGFPNTVAIPNGVPAFRPVQRVPRRTGRVRLGQIGGRTTHKGATLIEAVLRSRRFDNLALTLVDHASGAGDAREEVWGTTPVTLIGRVPQDRIGELYADLDVLLAPSLWPESFGLVTREARAAGLWVVASDRGAIGDGIREGIDGFRIDVGSPEGLSDVLARIDADPDRFRASPPPLDTPERSTAEQGDDLLAVYDRILRGRAEAERDVA